MIQGTFQDLSTCLGVFGCLPARMGLTTLLCIGGSGVCMHVYRVSFLMFHQWDDDVRSSIPVPTSVYSRVTG